MPIPVLSRSVRRAGSQRSCSDMSLALPGRHAGHLPGMRRGGGTVLPGGGAGGRLRSKQQVRWVLWSADGTPECQGVVCPAYWPCMSTGCVRVDPLRPVLHGPAKTASSTRRISARRARVGDGGHSRAGCPGRRIPGACHDRAHTGAVCARGRPTVGYGGERGRRD